ncbi:MAG: DUF2184 domain-containing protein [Rhodococcus sp.]|nr:DUF2184 domain-containing protein [Rhodococcus sp. (in: high G+C Gram-positive bacteria)]
MMNAVDGPLNLADAEHLAFVENQAAHIETTVYAERFAKIQYPMFAPISTEANEYANQILHYSEIAQGQAAWMATTANDVPLVNRTQTQHSVRVEGGWVGDEINLFEAAQAMMQGVPLTNQKAMAARRFVEEFIDDVFSFGAAEMGYNGFLNYPEISPTSVPNVWVDTDGEVTVDPKVMVRDMQRAVSDSWNETFQIERADTLVLPPSAFALASETAYGDNVDTTVLQFVKEHNVYTDETNQPLTVRKHRGLETAGAGNTRRMIAYENARDVLVHHMPMMFKFLPGMQVDPLTYRVIAIFRTAGLEVRRPGAFRYIDGI